MYVALVFLDFFDFVMVSKAWHPHTEEAGKRKERRAGTEGRRGTHTHTHHTQNKQGQRRRYTIPPVPSNAMPQDAIGQGVPAVWKSPAIAMHKRRRTPEEIQENHKIQTWFEDTIQIRQRNQKKTKKKQILHRLWNATWEKRIRNHGRSCCRKRFLVFLDFEMLFQWLYVCRFGFLRFLGFRNGFESLTPRRTWFDFAMILQSCMYLFHHIPLCDDNPPSQPSGRQQGLPFTRAPIYMYTHTYIYIIP